MKLSKNFLTHNSDDEKIIVSTGRTGFSGFIRSNSTASEIVELLKNDTTVEQITDKLASVYDASADVIRKDVENIIAQLRKIGAIDE